MATTYTAYSSSHLTDIGPRPQLVGSDTDTGVANAAQGSLSINSWANSKVYRPIASVDPESVLRPVVIVQWTPGYASFDVGDDSDDYFLLDYFPVLESGADTDVSVGTLSANFVWGAETIDLTQGIMGGADLQCNYPDDLATGSATEPRSVLDETSTNVYGYMVTELFPNNMPFALRLRIAATNGSGGSVNMAAGLWVAAV